MRKVLLLIAVIAIPSSLNAQDRSRPELFIGYAFESTDTGIKTSDFAGTGIPSTTLDQRLKVNGFNISGTGYLTKRFGLTGDFSAGFESRLDDFGIAQARSSFSQYNITGGPQMKFFGGQRVTPFVHALLGVSHRRLKLEAITGATSITSATDSTTSFAMNLGGGLDVRLNDRFDLRLIQIDYNPVFIRERTIEGLTFPARTANGVRFSIGLVIK